MAILTPNDKPLYFPDVELEGDALVSAIARAQLVAEGPLGANRPLELQPYTELIRISLSFQNGFLSRHPIDINSPLEIQGRTGNIRDSFGRRYALTDWMIVEEYQLDSEIGQITVPQGDTFIRTMRFTELRVSYYTGFDFAYETREVQEIKTAVGTLLSYQGLSPIQRYIQRDEVAGVTFSRGREELPADTLLFLKKYCPRVR